MSLWLPPLVIMVLIFIGSTAILSGENTSRFLVPLLKFIFPFADMESLTRVRWVLRKIAHIGEYALLAFFYWRAISGTFNTSRVIGKWNRKHAMIAWAAAVVYAASDEYHQSFVPSRVGSIMDVGFDSLGAAVGILIAYLIFRTSKKYGKCPGTIESDTTIIEKEFD